MWDWLSIWDLVSYFLKSLVLLFSSYFFSFSTFGQFSGWLIRVEKNREYKGLIVRFFFTSNCSFYCIFRYREIPMGISNYDYIVYIPTESCVKVVPEVSLRQWKIKFETLQTHLSSLTKNYTTLAYFPDTQCYLYPPSLKNWKHPNSGRRRNPNMLHIQRCFAQVCCGTGASKLSAEG